MLHRASLIVVAAVTRLRRLLSSALSWSPRRLLSFGRRAGGGGAESDEPHGAGASDADEGYSLERWDKEFYRDPLDAPQARLVALGACSQESRHSTSVVFRNAVADPPARCRVFWLDYQGKLLRYKTLDPGETHRQQTFETHPWTFTTVPTRGSLGEPKQRLVVDGSPVFFPRRPISGGDASAVAEVRRPSLRRWTHDGHILYPAFFKRVAQTFLLTHARIRREPPSSPPAPRRSRRLLEKRLLEASVSNDVGPASAEDDANAMIERDDRSSCDSVGEMFPEEPEPAPPTTTLGDLPPELAAYIVSLAAPRCPLYRAVEDAVLEANARGAADAELAIGAGDDQGEH